MHFTVIFESHESIDLSYGLMLIPCPVWMKGKKMLINLHRENPHYERGDLAPLLQREDIESKLAEGHRNAIVVIHSNGHGTQEYLSNLTDDLKEAGFTVQEAYFDAAES